MMTLHSLRPSHGSSSRRIALPRVRRLAVFAAVLTLGWNAAMADFSGSFAPGSFILSNNNADGSVNIAGAPASIAITGGNNGSSTAGDTSFTRLAPAAGRVVFDWAFTTTDGAQYDPFGYIQNGVFVQVTNNGGLQAQNGAATFGTGSGQSMGFRIHTLDNTAGASTTTISNFNFSSNVYWKGNTSGTWNAANWALDSAGSLATPQPDAFTIATFSATGAGNQNTTLGQDFTVYGLTVSDPAAVTIGGANTLTVSGAAGTGIDVQGPAGLFTMNAPLGFTGSSNRITVNNAAGAVINGNIGGSAGFAKTGAGPLTLATANSYSGGTAVFGNGGTFGGVLTAAVANAIPSGTALTIGQASIFSDSTFHTGGFAQTISSLTIYARNGLIDTIVNVGGGTLTVNGNISLLDTPVFTGNARGGDISASTGGTLNLGGAVRNVTLAGQTDAIELGINAVIANGGINYTGNPSVFDGAPSDLRLGALSANTYALGTTVNAGNLLVASTTTLGAATGGLTLNTSGTVASTVILNSAQTIGFLQTGTLGTGLATVNLNGAGVGLNVNQTSATTYAGVISGSGSLNKQNTGTLTLSGNNAYTGLTNVTGGTLVAGSNTALGATAAGTVVSNSGTLQLANGVTIGAGEALALDSGGNLLLSSGAASFNGPVTIQGGSTSVFAFGGSTLSLGGPISISDQRLSISGDGIVHVNGSIAGNATSFNDQVIVSGATTNLNAANTYQGLTGISNFFTVLNANVSNALPTLNGRSDMDMYLGTLNIAGASQAVASLGGTTSDPFIPHVTLGANTLTIGYGSGVNTTGLANADFPGEISGTGGLLKDQGSTQVLSGPNTYTGGTTISGGTLVANEPIAGGVSATGVGPVTVNDTGTLAGGNASGTSGSVRGSLAVDSGGILAPGNAGPGIFTVNGNSTLAGGSTLQIEINGTAAGSGYDQVKANGGVNLGGATLSLTGSHVAALAQEFLVIDNDGSDAVTGTFSGLPEASMVNLNGVDLVVSYVGGDGNDVTLRAPVVVTDLASLRQGIIDAPAGSLVVFDPSLDGGIIELDGTELLINKSLDFDATGLPKGLTVSGGNASRVFSISSGTVKLTGLTLTGGHASGIGGAITNNGDLTIDRCAIFRNSAGSGGAINNDGNLTVFQSTFFANVATSGVGGALWAGGTNVITSCTFVGNTAANAGTGGGIERFGSAPISINNSIVALNLPLNINGAFTGANNLTSGDPLLAPLGDYGGPTRTMPPLVGSPAIDAGGATVLLTDQRGFPRVLDGITPNGGGTAVPDIGAVEAGTVRLVNSTGDYVAGSLRSAISSAVDPGDRVLFNLPSSSVIVLEGEEILIDGGATVFIDASSLVDPSGEVAVELDPLDNPFTPGGVSVSGNDLSRVLRINADSNVAIDRLTVVHGQSPASLPAGGVWNFGRFTAVDSTFSDNTAASTGGGMENAGEMSLIQCTVSDNSASGLGGGIACFNYAGSGAMTLVNTTVAGNTAGQGGGIYSDGNLAMESCTVVGNTGDSISGGLYIFGETTLENCIVAANNPPFSPDIGKGGGTIASSGVNLIGNNVTVETEFPAGSPNGNGDLVGTSAALLDPIIGSLAYNGGPTSTMMLLAGSPAIDAGAVSVFTPSIDQRGFTRVLAGGLDIGAYEASAGSFNLAGLTVHAVVDPALADPDLVFEISSDPDFLPTVSTITGNGEAAFEDGPRATAQLSYPSGVARDLLSGNIYIADTGNHRIRMLSPLGVVSTIAGTGDFGFANGPGTTAMFAFPSAVAIDANGNVYVADTFNQRIRKLTKPAVTGQPWTVTTLAGAGAPGFLNGGGTVALFRNPQGLAVDAAGNVFVADSENHRIRMVTPAGLVSTFAGTGAAGLLNGERASAMFDTPFGVVFDDAGNLFVADRTNSAIRKIAPDGNVTTLSSGLNAPVALAVDGDDDLFVSDEGSNSILKVTNPGGVTTNVVGSGADFLDGNATIAKFSGPAGLLVTPSGELILADTFNHRIRRIIVEPIHVNALAGATDPAGTAVSAVIDVVALGLDPNMPYYIRWRSMGDDSSQTLGQRFYLIDPPVMVDEYADGLTTTAARLNATVNPNDSPTTVVFEYSTDPTLLGPWQVTTRAGSGATGSVDDVDPLAASFSGPQGVAVFGGDTFIADRLNHRIRKIAANGQVSTFAGSAAGFVDDVNRTSARFENPSGIAADTAGNLYVADELNHRIRKIATNGDVTTFAGSGVAGFADGASADARFLFPAGVAVDSSGNVYVADAGNHRIRKITPGGDVSTLAGSGTAGFADGAAASAQFSSPLGVAVTTSGKVLVADTGNHRIRRISAGNVVTLAGSGTSGFNDAGGTSALFSSPSGIAVDGSEVAFVTDRGNHRIRRVTREGQVSTVAGSGVADWVDSPVGGLYPATATDFDQPSGIAIDGTGSLLVTELGNEALRKIQRGPLPTLTVTPAINGLVDHDVGRDVPEFLLPGATYYFRTIASNSRGPTSGEIVGFSTLTYQQIAVYDGADTGSPELVSGQVTPVDFGTTPLNTPVARQFTIADNGGLPLTVSAINPPAGFDVAGGVEVIASGESTTFSVILLAPVAGTISGTVEIVSDDPAQGSFTFPVTGIVFDPPAVVTEDASAVEAESATLNATVNPRESSTTVWFEYSQDPLFDGVLVSTLAGSEPGYVNGAGLAAKFDQPSGLAMDSAGNTYVADTANHRIRKIAADGTTTTIAGTGVAGFANGPGVSAQFNEPVGVVVGTGGVLLVTDSKNHRIRAISASNTVTTFSGLGTPGFTDGVGTAARFNLPSGIAIDGAGILYIADRANHRVRKVATDGSVSTLSGTGVSGFLDGPAASAQFDSPLGIAVNHTGTVYLTEAASNRIRKITSDGTTSTFAGAAASGYVDANGASARFSGPSGLAVDSMDRLYVADTGNHRIRRVSTAGDVTTRAGSGIPGTADGLGDVAEFDSPVSLATNTTGTVVVGEFTHATIRKIVPTTVMVQALTGLNGNSDQAVTLPVTGLEAGMTYYFRSIATNSGGTTVGNTMTIGESGSPFTIWQNDKFGVDAGNPLIAGPGASPSHDGITNLMKYALGLEPNENSQAGLPVAGNSGGMLTLTYHKVVGATDLTYIVEGSTTLASWSTAGIAELVTGGDTVIQQITASTAVAGSPIKFLRLRVVLQQP